MDHVVGMAIFARVVEAASFSAAARHLGLSKAAVSKHVARLEHDLGTRLLYRTTRKLSLTEAGRTYYGHCARVVSEAAVAELELSQLRSQPMGLLKVATPIAFGTLHIAPAIAAFLERHAGLTVEMAMDDRVVSLAGEGFDVAVRMSSDPPPNVVARRLAPVRWVVCASPAYLGRRGIPLVPADLAAHNCLYHPDLDQAKRWKFTSTEGEAVVRISGSFSSHSSLALREAVLQGLGIACLPTFTVGRDLQEGTAVRLLAAHETHAGSAFYAVYLPTPQVSPKVRAFIDFFVERFSPEPYWDRMAAPRQ